MPSIKKCIVEFAVTVCLLLQCVSAAPMNVKVGFFAMDGYHSVYVDGSMSGFGYDFLQMVSLYGNLNFEYVGYDRSWADMQEMLLNGEIELLTAMRKTPERQKLFDFSKPIGRRSVLLNVRADDDRYNVDDYSTLDSMVVGLLKGSDLNKSLEGFFKKNHFTYIPKYFDDVGDLAFALQNKDVDGIISSSLQKGTGEKTVCFFGEEFFYAAVKKGNRKLLEELDYAISQMDVAEKSWRNLLYMKNYEQTFDTLQLSKREQEFVKAYREGGKVLKVLSGLDKMPFSYAENGEMKGVLPDVFKEIMAMTGMKYEFVVPKNTEEYYRLIAENAVQVVLDGESHMLERCPRWFLSPSYVTLSAATLFRKDFHGKVKTVAFAKQMMAMRRLVADNEDVNVVYCDSPEKAVEMVSEGKADVTFLYLYMAEEFVNHDVTGSLYYSVVRSFSYGFSYLVSLDSNHELMSVLSKCVHVLQVRTVDEIISANLTSSIAEMTALEYMRKHPVYIVVVVLLVVLLVMVIAFAVIRARMRQRVLVREMKIHNSLRKAQAEVTAASEAKSRFLFNMSHDIRTPMNAIIGYTDRIERNIDDKEVVLATLKKINISSEYLLQLINEVLDMARIESNKLELTPKACDIVQLSENLCNVFVPSMAMKKIDFTWDFSSIDNRYVMIDDIHFRQIMTNLISNANKYTGFGGKIKFTIMQVPCQRGGFCAYRLKVKDSGFGMTKEFQKHLFEEFSRETTTTQSGVIGTGLGMSIVKRLADLMGALIDVQSEKGVGTEVSLYVEFPMASKKDEETLVSEEPSEEKLESLQGRRVLLVEDNDFNREIARDILKDAGLQVDCSVDGAVAIHKINEYGIENYDCILMDVQMPIMDGYETTRKIRELYPDKHIPIIALSANAFEEDRQKSLAAGMDDHLSKPLDVAQLWRTLKRFMEKK